MTRRQWLGTAIAGTAGAAAAGRLADQYGLVPPDGTGIWAPGHTLTHASQRLLGSGAWAREFTRDQISRPSYANGRPPGDQAFLRHQETGFADWRLEIGGMVARPRSFPVAELRTYPAHSQITHLACEEGWSFIAEWTGVRLSYLLDLAGVAPQAKYVFYHSIQPRWWDSVDMAEALHPQTVIAWGMNGGDLPVKHGGPLRMRVPRQLGYKSVKYVTKLTVTDRASAFGQGKGSFAAERGYAWYSGI